jgi:serine/threonine-protein kinase HipA
LGVNDVGRMGGLRFKLDKNGSFLDDDMKFPTPPWTSIREVQNGIRLIESKKENAEINNWLEILLAPGSSLGGARPKANILDENQQLWIAKFPSKSDEIDKGLWEYLAYLLAIKSGIQMSDCKIEKVAGDYHTFFTKRFDRNSDQRLHFASAMTMTGNNELTLKDKEVGYLDIAEFIQFNLSESKAELHQLWRRIVFSILISNTDDHLRNHGFLLIDGDWKLSPAYDINPSIDKKGLSLNIDLNDNSLNIDLLVSVAPYFQLKEKECKIIIDEVRTIVSQWEIEAKNIGISRSEISLMRPAFRI